MTEAVVHRQGARGYPSAQEERKKPMKTDSYDGSSQIGADIINAGYDTRKSMSRTAYTKVLIIPIYYKRMTTRDPHFAREQTDTCSFGTAS